MKYLFLSVLTISSLFFFACKKSSIKEPKFEFKTKPLTYETLKSISQELKDKGFVDNRNFNRESNSLNTGSASDIEIREVIQPLIDNGRDLRNEIISFVENSQEWQSMTIDERNSIIHMSDEQLADLSLVYSSVQTDDLPSAIKDCVSLALGVAGIKNLAKSLVTAPTV